MTWVAGLVLAISAFTGWYSGTGDGVDVSVIGWNTGTLGKLVFFLGLALLAARRPARGGDRAARDHAGEPRRDRARRAATIFVLIRMISIPDEFFFAGRGIGIWISLAAALAVIVAGLLEASEEL